MNSIYWIFSWSSPIGIGVFLLLLSFSAKLLIGAISDANNIHPKNRLPKNNQA